MKIYIIAEAGVNHNGDVSLALKLVDAAVVAGADAVKFQSFVAERLASSSAKKISYQVRATGAAQNQLEMLKALELTVNEQKELYEYCKKRGITFLSTPFDEESVDFLDSLGLPVFKVPSGEITNKPFLQHAASKRKPILLSTGMATLGEVEAALGWIEAVTEGEQGIVKDGFAPLTLLHCTTEYPAAMEGVNLNALCTLRRAFGLPVGYSDHTEGIEVAVAAAALGAVVIEKHLTLDRSMSGPDHAASLEPAVLKELVRCVRNIELAMGTGIKRPTEKEQEARQQIRKGLVAAQEILKGTVVSAKDVEIKRPATGISPEYKEAVVGMRAGRSIGAGEPIKWEDFKDA